MSARVWFWINYLCLLVVALGCYWWIALANQDKILSEAALGFLHIFSLTFFGALCLLLGDFETTAIDSKGIKRIILRFFGPLFRSPFGLIVPIFLTFLLVIAFVCFRTVRLRSPLLKGSPEIRAFFEMREGGYSPDITETIKEQGWTALYRGDATWPRLVVSNECGMDRKSLPISRLFNPFNYLFGLSTDPMENMTDVKALSEKVNVTVHYRDTEGELKDAPGELNQTTANLLTLIDEGVLPADIFARASQALQKKTSLQVSNSADEAPPAPAGEKINTEMGPLIQFDFSSGGKDYRASFNYSTRTLDITELGGGQLSPKDLKALDNTMVSFAENDDPAQFEKVKTQFSKTNSIDQFRLWTVFFARLDTNGFWADEFPGHFDGLAKIVSLFVVDGSWMSEKAQHPLCEKTVELLGKHALTGSSESIMVRVSMNLLLASRPVKTDLLRRLIDAVKDDVKYDCCSELEEVLISELEVPGTLNMLYDYSTSQLEDLLKALSATGSAKNADHIKVLQDKVQRRIDSDQRLRTITSQVRG